MKKWLLPPLLLFTTLILPQSKGHDIEFGNPYIQNYGPKEYGASGNNYGILQALNGLMYFGNEDGVLEYDGVSWRLIEVANKGLVRSVAQDEEGKIYVGAIDDLGYLMPDTSGQLKFVTLKPSLPAHSATFGTVWEVHHTQHGTYFNTEKYLLRWADDKFKIWENPSLLSTAFLVHDQLFLYQKEVGLSKMVGDSLVLLASEAKFGHSMAMTILPYENGKILIATQKTGLFIWDGKTLNTIESSINKYFKENIIFNGTTISNNLFAFGTYRGGLVITDKMGALQTILTKETGLVDNTIIGAYLDRQGQLWLTTNNGISRVEVSTPISTFSETRGIRGVVDAIYRHQGTLFASTSHGLFFLDKSLNSNNPASFRPVSESVIYNFTFKGISMGDTLLIPSWGGIFEVKAGSVKKIFDYKTGYIHRSKVDPNRFYLGLKDGLASMYFENNKWLDEGRIDSVDNDIRKIVETSSGVLWVQPEIEGIWKVAFTGIRHNSIRENSRNVYHTKRFDLNNGLAEGRVSLHQMGNEVFFKMDRNTYEYDSKKDAMVLHPIFSKNLCIDFDQIDRMTEDDDANIWMWSNAESEGQSHVTVVRKLKDGNFSAKEILSSHRITQSVTNAIYAEQDGIVWFGGTDGIVRYDSNMEGIYTEKFNTLIRKVMVNGDSLIFYSDKYSSIPTLKFKDNSLQFQYATPYFDNEKGNHYSHILEGFDENWVRWTKETKKEYTNIPEGDYRFRVRARNIYGVEGQETAFDFTILPPWHRTWWAYLAYLLLFGGFLWAILKLRSRQLKAQNEALEKLIAFRTSEVRHQANQLKMQAEKLQELDKAKSRFFANISHEFRTPLTLIKGPIEQLEQNFTEKLNMETVKMIRRNANRLLNMVNQLLDLSKIDEGSLKLAPTEGDLYKCLRAAASSFNSHAAQRSMDYRVVIPPTMLWASFDRDKLENIIYNLLGNAFKFSGDGSQISFFAEYSDFGLQIRVTDAGKGIPAEKLPFIFDRFFQVDDSNTRDKGGSGIGLSLSKDLVELMDGTMTVSSEMGKGTIFTVQLPIQEIKTRQKKSIENIPWLEKSVVKKPFAFTKGDSRNLPTILLVEDNKDMRHFITEQLVKYYKVKEAVNGEVGLQKAIANPPDLVITDLMMPKMDGIELCKKLKTNVHTSHIPVIMLTAKAGMDNKIEGLETGADDYLTKPFDGKELLVRAKNLMDQRRKLRELYSDKKIEVHPKKVTVTSTDQKFLEAVLELLETRYTESDFGVPQMQVSLAMSKTQLHRKLKALTNEAPGELLRNFRLKRAAQLLSQKADSVTQIAYKVGFNNLSYFAKCFKELYGVSPSSY